MRYYIDQNKAIDPNPCVTCQTGWGSYINGRDEEGEFMEVKTCHDECPRLAEYLRKSIKKKDKRPICPDCNVIMNKTYIELEDGSGWFTGWGCECKYDPGTE